MYSQNVIYDSSAVTVVKVTDCWNQQILWVFNLYVVGLLMPKVFVCMLQTLDLVATVTIVTRAQMKAGNSDWYGSRLGYF